MTAKASRAPLPGRYANWLGPKNLQLRQKTGNYGKIREKTANYGKERQITAKNGKERQITANYGKFRQKRQKTALVRLSRALNCERLLELLAPIQQQIPSISQPLKKHDCPRADGIKKKTSPLQQQIPSTSQTLKGRLLVTRSGML